MSLDVTKKTITAVLDNLTTGNWKIPAFQREFVWKQSQVFALTDSIFRSRPIGLLTLWAQPPGNPHTSSNKVRLKTAEFGSYEQDPPQFALVLDGRQRLTSLAIVFGGLQEPSGRVLFSGAWFLDLNKDPNQDEIVLYKKRSEVVKEQLDNFSQCIAKGYFPLKDYTNFHTYLSRLHDPTRYPNSEMPDKSLIELRAERLGKYTQIFVEFQLPVAELPATITLPEVCEIFDVLNQTGTRVSTFDLIHNNIYNETNGTFNLRDSVAEWATLHNFGLLCSESRPDFLCQIVTGCYLSENDPIGKSKKPISSVKGSDLLNTPTEFYQKFQDNISSVNTYCGMLFSEDILGTRVPLKEIPYPVSLILYLSLSWARDMDENQSISSGRLTKLFKAFYWGNVLSTRYDQGFLTQFTKDRKTLYDILCLDVPEDEWEILAEKELSNKIFTSQDKRRSLEDIREVLLNGNIRGAIADAIKLFLFSKVKTNLIDGEPLTRVSTEQSQRVDLHHFYPLDWCKNNSASNPILLNQDQRTENSFANLIPLRADTNRIWKTKEPRTAIEKFTINIQDVGVLKRFEDGFIDADAIQAMKDGNVELFWNHRATLMAEKLFKLQFVHVPADQNDLSNGNESIFESGEETYENGS